MMGRDVLTPQSRATSRGACHVTFTWAASTRVATPVHHHPCRRLMPDTSWKCSRLLQGPKENNTANFEHLGLGAATGYKRPARSVLNAPCFGLLVLHRGASRLWYLRLDDFGKLLSNVCACYGRGLPSRLGSAKKIYEVAGTTEL